MQRLAFVVLALGGCLSNPSVDVDKHSVDLARGTSSDVLVSIDGEPVTDLDGVWWSVDDPDVATVTPAYDGCHLRIGGDLEGETIVRVSSYGQVIEIPTRIGPPALLAIWPEPPSVAARVGDYIEVKAKALDTLARVRDVTFDSRWTLRDATIASLDQAGMMLHATGEGTTTLHVKHGTNTAVVPISIFK